MGREPRSGRGARRNTDSWWSMAADQSDRSDIGCQLSTCHYSQSLAVIVAKTIKMANVPLLGLKTHSQKVCSLYKRALRNLEAYYDRRYGYTFFRMTAFSCNVIVCPVT